MQYTTHEKLGIFFKLHLTDFFLFENTLPFPKISKLPYLLAVCRTHHWQASVHMKDAPFAGQRPNCLFFFFFFFLLISSEGL
jgi:hypothetical protein